MMDINKIAMPWKSVLKDLFFQKKEHQVLKSEKDDNLDFLIDVDGDWWLKWSYMVEHHQNFHYEMIVPTYHLQPLVVVY